MQRFCVKFIFIAKLNGGILIDSDDLKVLKEFKSILLLFFVLIYIILSFFLFHKKRKQ